MLAVAIVTLIVDVLFLGCCIQDFCVSSTEDDRVGVALVFFPFLLNAITIMWSLV